MIQHLSTKSACLSSDFPSETIKEGQVQVHVPALKAYVERPSDYAPSKAPVFYNPVMEFNRDVAVLAVQAYQRIVGRAITICEPLTGSGLRGIRLAKEVQEVKSVVINDINHRAFELASRNVKENDLDGIITVKNDEANMLLNCYSAPRKRFDVIDIDPFGSPVPFIESAIRSIKSGGLIAMTATDMAPLCGVHPKACMRRYNGKPLRTEYCHELATRLLCGVTATSAAKHDISIKPLFAHRAEHYIRVYACIKYGAGKADDSLRKMGYILHCFDCLHRETIRGLVVSSFSLQCPECGRKLSVAGPLWIGKVFDETFVEDMLTCLEKRSFRLKGSIRKTLELICQEASMPPTYYVIDELCHHLGLPVPSTQDVLESLQKEGYKACLTHFHPKGIRSNAPAREMAEKVTSLIPANLK